jgi:hypothetical protein
MGIVISCQCYQCCSGCLDGPIGCVGCCEDARHYEQGSYVNDQPIANAYMVRATTPEFKLRSQPATVPYYGQPTHSYHAVCQDQPPLTHESWEDNKL